MGVELGPQLEQGLESNFYKNIIRQPIADSPEELNDDEGKAKKQNRA